MVLVTRRWCNSTIDGTRATAAAAERSPTRRPATVLAKKRRKRRGLRRKLRAHVRPLRARVWFIFFVGGESVFFDDRNRLRSASIVSPRARVSGAALVWCYAGNKLPRAAAPPRRRDDLLTCPPFVLDLFLSLRPARRFGTFRTETPRRVDMIFVFSRRVRVFSEHVSKTRNW